MGTETAIIQALRETKFYNLDGNLAHSNLHIGKECLVLVLQIQLQLEQSLGGILLIHFGNVHQSFISFCLPNENGISCVDVMSAICPLSLVLLSVKYEG